MQNDQLSIRTRNIIEDLEELWQYPQEPSPDDLKQITEFVVGLQEPYKTIGLKKIAEHIISNISLHVLAIMSTFQRKAEEEGISSEDCDQTFKHINPSTFQILDELSKHLSIHSLDDLLALCNITIGLQTLSQVNSAEEAQGWLYQLPKMYYQQLSEENLVVNVKPPTSKEFNENVSQSTPSTNWLGYDKARGIITFGTGTTTSSLIPVSQVEPIELPVFLKPNKKTSSYAA